MSTTFSASPSYYKRAHCDRRQRVGDRHASTGAHIASAITGKRAACRQRSSTAPPCDRRQRVGAVVTVDACSVARVCVYGAVAVLGWRVELWDVRVGARGF